MTVEQAITEIKQSGLHGNQVHQETLVLALNALREKAERDNPQPLTLDELRKMDGQPVWVVFDTDACWLFVDVSLMPGNIVRLFGRSAYLVECKDMFTAYRYPLKEAHP